MLEHNVDVGIQYWDTALQVFGNMSPPAYNHCFVDVFVVIAFVVVCKSKITQHNMYFWRKTYNATIRKMILRDHGDVILQSYATNALDPVLKHVSVIATDMRQQHHTL